MTRTLTLWLILTSATTFSANLWAADEINTTFFGNLAIEGYDPVAYFKENKAVAGSKAHEFVWKDAKWRFSSAENLSLFKADPQKYAPQYGGYCAYAVAQNDTAGIDPDQFTIVDGKLYLNYNAKIQASWLEQRDTYIEAADRNWPDVLR
ncbi:MAG: YHS domain-containing (seleno)protein [Pseudomonadales bacterium]